ncbi:hypothetical protein C9374_000757 [Naegleria lovaniensis]|uniref:Uncharacterized protein n=1 Tax=Naegleria lovaniensis TaxID=51637 RepID=A0AA88GS66_NAELO|nr:uncharacterized protein C9374_000757 [Naegleria lovaniensis]KAG2387907.1 hypothetical protein C9374_000757 [Naegleria lovaniensis]
MFQHSPAFDRVDSLLLSREESLHSTLPSDHPHDDKQSNHSHHHHHHAKNISSITSSSCTTTLITATTTSPTTTHQSLESLSNTSSMSSPPCLDQQLSSTEEEAHTTMSIMMETNQAATRTPLETTTTIEREPELTASTATTTKPHTRVPSHSTSSLVALMPSSHNDDNTDLCAVSMGTCLETNRMHDETPNQRHTTSPLHDDSSVATQTLLNTTLSSTLLSNHNSTTTTLVEASCNSSSTSANMDHKTTIHENSELSPLVFSEETTPVTNTSPFTTSLFEDLPRFIQTKSRTKLTQLEDDMLGLILTYCDISQFESLASTCRLFYHKFSLSYMFQDVFTKVTKPSRRNVSSIPSDLTHVSPFLKQVLRQMYHPVIFVPLRCMQFNAYTLFKDAIIDYWVKEYGFRRLNDAEVEVDVDLSKPIPWLDELEKIINRPQESLSAQKQQESTVIIETIENSTGSSSFGGARNTANSKPFVNVMEPSQTLSRGRRGSQQVQQRTVSSDDSNKSNTTQTNNTANILLERLKTILEVRNSAPLFKYQTVSNKFTDANEIDATDTQRNVLNNSTRHLIVVNHWKAFDKFTLHIDFQFPTHERNFSFVEMPEITLYYHNFRSLDGNPRKDLIEISSGSVFKDGVNGKVYQFDASKESSSSPTHQHSATPLECKNQSSLSTSHASIHNRSIHSPKSRYSNNNAPNNNNKPSSASLHSTTTISHTTVTSSSPANTSNNLSNSNPQRSAPSPPASNRKSSLLRWSLKSSTPNNNQSATSVTNSNPTHSIDNRKRDLEMRNEIAQIIMNSYETSQHFDYDVSKVSRMLLYFILHDFTPRFFSDYFSPKIAALESKTQQAKLQHLMDNYEKTDSELAMDFLTINKNQLKSYRNKMVKRHTHRVAKQHTVKDNCISLVRNLTKLMPYVNYNRLSLQQREAILRTFLLNHVNPNDFLATSDQLFMSSSFSGLPSLTTEKPFHVQVMNRTCRMRDDQHALPFSRYLANFIDFEELQLLGAMNASPEMPFSVFHIYFDVLFNEKIAHHSIASDFPQHPVNTDKIVIQRHILEIPTEFSLRWTTYQTPKESKDTSNLSTASSRSVWNPLWKFISLFTFCSCTSA